MAKKTLNTDAEVKDAVDALLGAFGVVGEADNDFSDAQAGPAKKAPEPKRLAPSAAVDALWGAPHKK